MRISMQKISLGHFSCTYSYHCCLEFFNQFQNDNNNNILKNSKVLGIFSFFMFLAFYTVEVLKRQKKVKYRKTFYYKKPDLHTSK